MQSIVYGNACGHVEIDDRGGMHNGAGERYWEMHDDECRLASLDAGHRRTRSVTHTENLLFPGFTKPTFDAFSAVGNTVETAESYLLPTCPPSLFLHL